MSRSPAAKAHLKPFCRLRVECLQADGICYICTPQDEGPVAEGLGKGLQNLVQRFESARDLKTKAVV
jgi:hypothetical protein